MVVLAVSSIESSLLSISKLASTPSDVSVPLELPAAFLSCTRPAAILITCGTAGKLCGKSVAAGFCMGRLNDVSHTWPWAQYE